MLQGSNIIHIILLCVVSLSLSAQAEQVRVKIFSKSIQKIEITGHSIEVQNKGVNFKKVSIGARESLVLKELLLKEKEIYLWRLEHQKSYQEKVAPFLYIKGKNLSLSGIKIPGEVFLWPKDSKTVDVVAILDAEEYLMGVIPSEMPLDWPVEALKAQAVLARSYTLFQMKKNKSRYYHLDGSVLDQKYTFGMSWNHERDQKLRRVLKETQNEVLVNHDGDLVKVFYHADCGGKTELSSAVWGGESFFDSRVVDRSCPSIQNTQWTYEIQKKDLIRKLLLKGDLKNIRLDITDKNTRPAYVTVVTTSETQRITPQVMRAALGYQAVRSGFFNIEIQGDRIRFLGRGFGHGVGLCQNGARNLAKNNKNYKEILQHYFPKLQFAQLSHN